MTSAGGPDLVDVYAAQRRIRRHLSPTPLLQSAWLSSITGGEVHLKIESLQPSRSFKIRGALNAAMRLSERSHSPRTIVTASAGNHGQGVAIAAGLLGLRAIVHTPANAPDTKKQAMRRYGAELNDTATDYDTAEQQAREHARDIGAPYISPYNHPDVIAGAATIALELLSTLPTFDMLVVPLGGGGLASGLGMVMKAAAPHVTIVGVEAEASTPFATGIARGAITEIAVQPSLADGLTGNLEPGSMTFELVGRYVDRLVTVSEDELAQAIRGLAAEEHLIAEAAGAAATAAVMARKAIAQGQRAVVMLTGANIDLATLIRVLGS